MFFYIHRKVYKTQLVFVIISTRNDNFHSLACHICFHTYVCATHGVPILLTRCQSLAAQQCLRVHCASVKSPRSLAGRRQKDNHPFLNIMVLSRDGRSDLDSLLEKLNCRDQKEKNIFGFMRIFGYPNGQKILMAFSSLVLVMVFFRLEWKAPEDNGGSQIVQYEVCYQ